MESEEEFLARRLGPSEQGGSPDEFLPGLDSTPRIRRTLFHHASSPPTSPAIDSTLTAPPLLPTPQWALDDPISAGTLRSHPHLFSVDTPLHIGRLRALLVDHPNRPLIDSVLAGLENGFWPGYVGDADSLNSLSPGPPPPELEIDDWTFIASTLEKDFELGFLSEPFSTLLPGMVVSPSFVVRIDGRKPRNVVDQTASGLNDGVPKEAAKVHYDTIAELGRLLRFGNSRGTLNGVVWKSDVSKAFRSLPVAKEWQLRQVHRSRVVDARTGRRREIFYVDQRVVFGGRLSPKLWCTVINVVLWGVKEHLRNEHLFVYVDDIFSVDYSHLLVTVTHPVTGESRAVPRDQARVLTVWSTVGVPWDWDKQIFGTSLVVLGHDIDAVALTVSLPAQAKLDFIAYLESFLATDSPPLFRWQRLAGYSQWACTTIPLARFSLNSVYKKIAGKRRRNAPIRLNVDVKSDLVWLINEFKTAPPLDLLDGSLGDWHNSEADVVCFTDACLEAHGNEGSGLGYWYKRAGAAHRSFFFARISPALDNIFLGESLAIASAVDHLVRSGVSRRRLLIFSDSALSVYGFDSGRAQGVVSGVIRRTYELLRSYKVDLRVRHVAGTTNSTADALSRDVPSTLRQNFPLNLRRFTPVPFSQAHAPEEVDQ